MALNTHHIAIEVVLHQVQWEELRMACGAVADGVELELGGLELQYGDYAVWQRRWFGGGRLEEKLGWWKAALGEVPVLELQPDFDRPTVLGKGGGWVGVHLDGTQALQMVCRRQGGTQMHGALGLWAMVLCKHTRQGEVVTGTPYANRGRPGLERGIGYFVNTLVVLVRVETEARFGSVVHGARKAMLGCLEHGEAPFVKVVAAVVTGRDNSWTPVYQSTVGWQEVD